MSAKSGSDRNGPMTVSLSTLTMGKYAEVSAPVAAVTRSNPPATKPRTTEVCRTDHTGAPLLVTRITGESSSGAKPATESTRWVIAGITSPFEPGASMVPSLPHMSISTVASTSLPLVMTNTVSRPRLVSPPTSHASLRGSPHSAASTPRMSSEFRAVISVAATNCGAAVSATTAPLSPCSPVSWAISVPFPIMGSMLVTNVRSACSPMKSYTPPAHTTLRCTAEG